VEREECDESQCNSASEDESSISENDDSDYLDSDYDDIDSFDYEDSDGSSDRYGEEDEEDQYGLYHADDHRAEDESNRIRSDSV
jgi:hypothetical protein